jgi:hypothetical protein
VVKEGDVKGIIIAGHAEGGDKKGLLQALNELMESLRAVKNAKKKNRYGFLGSNATRQSYDEVANALEGNE